MRSAAALQMLHGANIKFEIGSRGLAEAIDDRVRLLRRHSPYHESDHVLNVAYSVVCGGRVLEDIELSMVTQIRG